MRGVTSRTGESAFLGHGTRDPAVAVRKGGATGSGLPEGVVTVCEGLTIGDNGVRAEAAGILIEVGGLAVLSAGSGEVF